MRVDKPARRTEHTQLAVLDEVHRNLFQEAAHRAGPDKALHEAALEQIALDAWQDAAGEKHPAMRAVQKSQKSRHATHRAAEHIERLLGHGLAVLECGGS